MPSSNELTLGQQQALRTIRTHLERDLAGTF
jgi:hypothetical protein